MTMRPTVIAPDSPEAASGSKATASTASPEAASGAGIDHLSPHPTSAASIAKSDVAGSRKAACNRVYLPAARFGV